MIVLTGTKRAVDHLAIGPGGNILAANGGGLGVELWDLPSGNQWGRYESGMHFADGPVAFHPAKPLSFAHARHGLAEIETDTKKARTLDTPYRSWSGVWDLAPDGESFVGYLHGLGGISRFRRKADGTLKADWSVPPEKWTQKSFEAMHPLAFRVSPGGDWFVCVEGERIWQSWECLPVRLSVRSMKRGAVLGAAEIPSGTHPWPAVAPAGSRFATFCADRLAVWDADDLEAKPRRVKNDSRSRFTGVAFHPSGRYLAATSNDATVKLYDTTSWQVAKTYTWDIGRMRSVAFSPDGTLAAAGSDTGKVVVWDVDV